MLSSMTRIGLQIPNFTYPDVEPGRLFETVATIATTGEDSGFDTIFVMDHFFQLPLIGPPRLEMFDSYTLLGALAARTQRARLGTLVTGVTYRNPAQLAKAVTAVDVISGGRALLGIGAAWFEEEHAALGFEFPPLSERYEHLEDALQICRAMFTREQSTVKGTHHQIVDAWNSPRPITPGGPPILVGGTGEKKTFRLAAQYADELNINAAFADMPRKLDALAGHLDRLGRDRREITTSCLGTIVVGTTHDEAAAKLTTMLQARGVTDPSEIVNDAAARTAVLPRLFFGNPDEVVAQVHDLLATGLEGVVVNMLGDGHDPDAVRLAGKTLTKAFAS
jgi:F420-dependent oxidoreductase-like protein